MRQAQAQAKEIGRRLRATGTNVAHRTLSRWPSDTEDVTESPARKNYFPHFSRSSSSTDHERSSDRYERRRTIGHGGFGEVYEAWDNVDGELVAIKQVQWSTLFNLRKDKVAHRELDLLRTFEHPYIVVYKDAFIDNGLYSSDLLLVMELCDHDLSSIILCSKTVIDTCTAIRYMACISSAINYLHSKQVIHRDMKPQNVLLSKGTPKVTDFGLACFAGAEAENQTKMRRTIAGTPQYTAPELLSGVYDESVDIWGLGCIFYELLSRRCFERNRAQVDKLPVPRKLRMQLGLMISPAPHQRPTAAQCLEFFNERQGECPVTAGQPYFWIAAALVMLLYLMCVLLL